MYRGRTNLSSMRPTISNNTSTATYPTPNRSKPDSNEQRYWDCISFFTSARTKHIHVESSRLFSPFEIKQRCYRGCCCRNCNWMPPGGRIDCFPYPPFPLSAPQESASTSLSPASSSLQWGPTGGERWHNHDWPCRGRGSEQY